jgi:hypothetical protein
MNSHLWWVHAHYSPQLVELWSCVSSPLLSHTPPQEKNRWFRRSHKARSLIWSRWRFPNWLLRQGRSLVHFIFIYYFVIRLPLCNKYSNYCDIYLYTLCYYLCCLLGACMRCTWLCSLKPGVTGFATKIKLELVVVLELLKVLHVASITSWALSTVGTTWGGGVL